MFDKLITQLTDTVNELCRVKERINTKQDTELLKESIGHCIRSLESIRDDIKTETQPGDWENNTPTDKKHVVIAQFLRRIEDAYSIISDLLEFFQI